MGVVAEVLSASGGAFVLEVSGGTPSVEADPFDNLLSSLDKDDTSEQPGGSEPETVIVIGFVLLAFVTVSAASVATLPVFPV